MTITVAIPSYNKEKYIERCIKSVLGQIPRPNEILVIDNCSIDKTFELVKKFAPEIKCVRNSSNLGMAGNWNRCIELCNTDLLMILHADDELLPGAIGRYLEFFRQYPETGLVHAHFYNIRNQSLSVRQLVNTGPKELVPAGLLAMGFPQGYHCSTMVVRKSAYDNLGKFIESMASDLEMWIRIASRYNIGNLGEPSVNVYLDNNSVGHNALKNRSIKIIEADLQNLSRHVNRLYPESQQKYRLSVSRKSLAGALLVVCATNLKSRQYRQAIEALWKALFKYGGYSVAIKFIWFFLKYRLELRRLAAKKLSV
jgi:glycosyltransferase involved in cell wall biosynthesis